MAQKSVAMRMVRKKVDKHDEYLKDAIREDLAEIHVPELKEIIMADYDAELSFRVTNRKSKTNPTFYREEFVEALDEFEWLDTGTNYTKVIVPDMENFNWGYKRLRVIQNILDGTIGAYVEISEEQYIAMFKKTPLVSQAYDKSVPRKQRIYLLRYNAQVQRQERITYGKRVLVRYPFSNTPPIDIFETATRFSEDTGTEFVAKSIKKATKEYYK